MGHTSPLDYKHHHTGKPPSAAFYGVMGGKNKKGQCNINDRFDEAIIGYYDSNGKFHNTACSNYNPVIESLIQHLDKHIEPDCMPYQGGNTDMAKINRAVMINGEKRWIRANTEQEYADKLIRLLDCKPPETDKHPFNEYAWNWFEVYSKPNIETVTATTYKRQLTRYLIPVFEGMMIEDITTNEVQRLFNGMNTAKATKDKVKIVLNQILEAAKDDKLITNNPLKSKRLKITGTASKATQPYSVSQMQYIIQHIDDIQSSVDRAYMALQALHPLRLEEVLGLQWGDIDTKSGTIHIRRAVTHPTRNQPEIKRLKTDSSVRVIGLSELATSYLTRGEAYEFVIGGKTPLSYTQVRRMCNRVQKDIGFDDKITPIRFRTTVLTDIYDQTKDIKLTQAVAGHTTANMTLKYYVKGREGITNAVGAVDTLYKS